jgi:hypothetical protein
MRVWIPLSLVAWYGEHLYHPLVIHSHVTEADYARLNSAYLRKRRDVRKARIARNWKQYIDAHERPYRLAALHRAVKRGLRDTDYWNLAVDVWIDSENIYQHRRLWCRTWQSTRPGRLDALNPEELEAYSRLGVETTVRRGVGHPKAVSGLSWTTDRDKGIGFAKRFQILGRRPLLATGVFLN